MIFGIGVDVLEAARVKKLFDKYGEHFVERLLLPGERAQFERTKRKERFLAMRFAAKEAIVKAMGTGFAHGMWIRDVGVVQNEWGRPDVVYSERGEKMRRKLGIGGGYITLTDEAGLIVAVCVLEAAEKSARKPVTRNTGVKADSKLRSKSRAKPKSKAAPAKNLRRGRR